MQFFATAAKGTEGALRDELRSLRIRRVRATRGGVGFEGQLVEGFRAALWTRLAQRLLLQLGAGPAGDPQQLYETVRALPWADYLTVRSTFAVQATGKAPGLTHTGFVALKVKDAIVDALRERLGARPDVDPRRPDVSVVVHLAHGEATISLDLAGEALHRRGWRTEGGEAPLKETLAAAVLALGGRDPERPFLDPMCGSGTLAIESALSARRIAPGLGRRFGFERWPTLGAAEKRSFREVLDEARAAALPRAPAPHVARDRFAAPLELALRNAERARVDQDIVFEQRDVRDLGELPPGCQIFTNPPYGERLAPNRLQLEGLFRGMGEAWRGLPGDHPLVVLAGSASFERAFGTRAAHRHTLFNGPLEVHLLTFRREGAEDGGK